MNIPANLKYDVEQHLWFDIDGDTVAIGITDFAQDQLGDILFVDLPESDDEFAEGEEFTEVESGKKATAIEIPFGITIIESNEELDDEPEKINEDAYAAWIVKAKVEDPSVFDDLGDAAAYEAAIAE
ncbi:glycine cleavage system protein H [Eubacterium barkeri]|uniref:Glycine cleavage system H protein n=1 Tax=Eubacterium barkeri TaxID=1528 RepID=A0A1H3EHA8_EUBBA|nr:glycine cleavage system protein GcvH [Eubacterium barkeri]SDX78126.1 glycine cleavage system H protein [Eubacterium barkeri]